MMLCRNQPSQMSPLAQMNFPCPCFVPCQYQLQSLHEYPQQEVPSIHSSLPQPCCTSQYHSPVYLDPSLCRYTPRPCALSSFHCPTYTSPSAWMSLPIPLALSSTHSPSYSELSSHTCLPCPLRIPLANWPMYLVPFSSWMGPLVRKPVLGCGCGYSKGPSLRAICRVCGEQKSAGSRWQLLDGYRVSVCRGYCQVEVQDSQVVPIVQGGYRKCWQKLYNTYQYKQQQYHHALPLSNRLQSDYHIQQLITMQPMQADLYCSPLPASALPAIYNSFNALLGDPQPLCPEPLLLAQPLTNPRQKVISVDSLRTRSSMFDQQLRAELELMLTHYCRVEGIEYKQGLNEIAAPFVWFRQLGVSLGKCEAMFHVFFRKYCLNFYDNDENFNSIELFVKMLSLVLKYHDPALARYLSWHQIEPQLFCINWLMTLFASKLSLSLIYPLWMFIAAQRDKFLLFFIVLAIVQLRRQAIIESKNTNVLQVVTNLIFKQYSALKQVIERALLLRLNTPSSITLFFRDRHIFQRREQFADIAQLLLHLQKLSTLTVMPGELTLDAHTEGGLCEQRDTCYFCDMRRQIEYNREQCTEQLRVLLDISNDIRTIRYSKQYVVVDVRAEQGGDLGAGVVFKVDPEEPIELACQRFIAQFIEEKTVKHFVFVVGSFSFENETAWKRVEIERMSSMVESLDSMSFPLMSILQGGFEAFTIERRPPSPAKTHARPAPVTLADLALAPLLPHQFPLTISDRCLLGSCLLSPKCSMYLGLVQALLITDYYLLILPLQPPLLSFLNYFQHSHSILEYLFNHPHSPPSLMVHNLIPIRQLKKASMKIHNQNILVLICQGCEHQERVPGGRLGRVLAMDLADYAGVDALCRGCPGRRRKIVLELRDADKVRQCVAVLTTRYMGWRRALKDIQGKEREKGQN